MTNTIDVGGLPKGLPRGKTAERILFAEMLSRLETIQATQTVMMERYQGRTVNNVLHVETATFGTDGQISRNFHAPAGCIQVDNPSATNKVTVAADGPMGAAPPLGVGVFVVPAAKTRTVALASTIFTLYGTSGDTVSFQVFTAAPVPGVV